MKTIRAGWKQKLHSETYSKSFTVIRGLAVGACHLINCSCSLFWNVLTLKVASTQVIAYLILSVSVLIYKSERADGLD